MRLSVLPSARTDVRNQVEYYLELGLPHVADHFQLAVSNAIRVAMKRPRAGSPQRLHNPALAGLRTWAVKGFDQFRIYYVASEDTLKVVRVLHSKRDISTILEKHEIDDSGSD
jgi:toxin ParE1/3/4